MAATYHIRVAFVMDEASDMPTVVDAVDEYTEDSWDGIPDFFAEKVAAAQKGNTAVRVATISVPESAILGLFRTQTILGTVEEVG